MTIHEAQIIDLPKILDRRGNLSIIEEFKNIPFKIERSYWIYDVPGGEARGGHAYKENQEFIVALSGSFDVVLDDGKEKKTFSLNRSYYGLYVPKGLWREMNNFSTNSLALVLASTAYTAEDYIYDYQEFISWNAKL
jgi:dTDP-4-dehydrorhamnose 3,5-epimerase-like enzyme